MFMNRILYAIAILTLFRVVWQSYWPYYDDLFEVNYALMLTILRSLVIFVVVWLCGRSYFSHGHRKLLLFVVIIGACGGYQLFIAHTEAEQWDRTVIAYEALFQDFSLDKEKTIDVAQKYPTSEYGEFAQLLVGFHTLRVDYGLACEESAPCFERLLECCNPHDPLLVERSHRLERKQAVHDLIDDLNSYQWRLTKVWKDNETVFEQMEFTKPSTRELSATLFHQHREVALTFVDDERHLGHQMCNTWLEILDFLNIEDERFWWDEELVFLGHAQQCHFADLLDKVWNLYQQLLKLDQEKEPRVLGTPPYYGLT